jgi:hypothetical protein
MVVSRRNTSFSPSNSQRAMGLSDIFDSTSL